jgi:hypothetical protein
MKIVEVGPLVVEVIVEVVVEVGPFVVEVGPFVVEMIVEMIVEVVVEIVELGQQEDLLAERIADPFGGKLYSWFHAEQNK